MFFKWVVFAFCWAGILWCGFDMVNKNPKYERFSRVVGIIGWILAALFVSYRLQ